MPLYIYEGPGTSLSIAGRSLDRGQPTSLEGRAAESAAAHPDIRKLGEATTSKPTSPRVSALTAHAALKQKAKALGIPPKGKADELVKAIAAEEKRLAIVGQPATVNTARPATAAEEAGVKATIKAEAVSKA